MAIEFLQAQKRQRYLIICATLLVVWLGFFRTPAAVAPASLPLAAPPKIEINWDALKDAKLEALESFLQIPPLKDKAGRANPFTSYK